MQKFFTSLGIVAVCAGLVWAAGSITSVSSHSTPSLVDEINVSLAEADVRLDAVESGGGTAPAGIALASAKIIVGGASGTGAAVTVSGDLTNNAAGEFTVVSGAVSWSEVTKASTVISKTNTLITADGYTNSFVFIDGVLKSWTVTP